MISHFCQFSRLHSLSIEKNISYPVKKGKRRTKSVRCIAVDPNIKLNTSQIERLSSRFKVITKWSSGMEVEGLLVHSPLSAEFLKSIKGLKWIVIRAKNLDYVPDSLGLKVVGIPSLGSASVSEHVFGLILGLYKQTIQSHHNVQAGLWREGLPPNRELAGKTLGIIGYGTIGKQVAEIAKGFRMEISFVTTTIGSLEETLRKSDIVTLHVIGPTVKNLISSPQLAMMKKSAILINTSRGYCLDQEALLNALDNNLIFAAGLDVFAEEPFDNENRLANHPRILCSPHTGFWTEETLDKMNEALINRVLSDE